MDNSKVYDPSEANKATVNSIGTSGRIRLEATEEYIGEAFAVMPITADFTYGVGCEASVGDAPAEDEAVSEREFDFGLRRRLWLRPDRRMCIRINRRIV